MLWTNRDRKEPAPSGLKAIVMSSSSRIENQSARRASPICIPSGGDVRALKNQQKVSVGVGV
jgi:hypothetical protein